MREAFSKGAGKSVRLFLVDGTPTGLMTAEIMNWTGHALLSPRSRLVDALQRAETLRTGIYILIGDDPDHPSREKVYIGEGDNIRQRVKQHANEDAKEFWQRTCFITSKDQNLTKAHVRYLESRLIGIARGAGRATVANLTAPEISLPESDTSDMEHFLSQIILILPVVGITAFRLAPRQETTFGSTGLLDVEDGIRLMLAPRKYAYSARAIERDGEFVVLKGSTAAANPEHSVNSYESLRAQLIEDGVLAVSKAGPGLLEFMTDYVFRSSSAAGSVINGRNTSGPREWRLVERGISLKEYQQEQLEALEAGQ